MTQKDHIVQELKELNSSLVNLSRQQLYTVPAGYFDNLTQLVLNRIQAIESGDAEALNLAAKENPYVVPDGYFDTLADNVLNRIRKSDDYQSAEEELASLSQFLSGLNKAMPYTVPDGYFENVTATITAVTNTRTTKVVSMGSRKWFRYAAAAVVTGLVVLSGFLYFGRNSQNAEPGKNVMAKITRDVKSMDMAQQDDLIDFIDAGLNGKESVQSKNTNKSTEVQDLLIGISDDELKDFQEQSEDIQAVLLVN